MKIREQQDVADDGKEHERDEPMVAQSKRKCQVDVNHAVERHDRGTRSEQVTCRAELFSECPYHERLGNRKKRECEQYAERRRGDHRGGDQSGGILATLDT